VKFKSINFTCKNCGGSLLYTPKSNSLECPFCSTIEPIEKSNQPIKKYDFDYALRNIDIHKRQIEKRELKCIKCSAPFELDANRFSSLCPYCETPVITELTQEIKPKSLIPFSITQKEAQKKFREWIGSLWFAPKGLKDFVDGHSKLTGYYLPYWGYDTNTTTQYHGQRGDIYYVTVQKRVIIDGREQIVNQREARINWTPVRGVVYDKFNNIIVEATTSLSHDILDNLAPWDTNKLVAFNNKYISGFNSEEYSITLDNGFNLAKTKIDRKIYQHIKRDIGGDQQRVEYKDTQYKDILYRHTLFPIWTAQFKWKNKTYNYAINAQTGKVVGDRPYSWLKITLLVITILIILGGFFWFAETHPQYFESIQTYS